MHMRVRAAAAIAALLQAFAVSAHAEELHKDGMSNSGVKLSYEATALPGGQLQIDFVLECRQSKLDTIYGVGVIAVINKSTPQADIKKDSLSCQVSGSGVTASHKTTSKLILPNLTPADIGTKLFVLGRSETAKTPRTDVALRRAEEALQKEMDKVTAS